MNRSFYTAQLPLLAGYGFEEIPIPASVVGLTLVEIDLPKKFQLNCLAIHRSGKDGTEELVPPPVDLKLAVGDRLVLLGKKENLKRFRKS